MTLAPAPALVCLPSTFRSFPLPCVCLGLFPLACFGQLNGHEISPGHPILVTMADFNRTKVSAGAPVICLTVQGPSCCGDASHTLCVFLAAAPVGALNPRHLVAEYVGRSLEGGSTTIRPEDWVLTDGRLASKGRSLG